MNIGGLHVPKPWLLGVAALLVSAFVYFGAIHPRLFPAQIEISEAVIDIYLKGKGIPLSSEEAKVLRDQLARVSADLEDLRTRNPETADEIALAVEQFEKGEPGKAIVNLERLICIIDAQREKMTKDQATAEHTLAALGYVNNAAKALPHYRKAAELAGTDIWYWIDYGRTAVITGDTGSAKTAFAKAQAEAEKQGDEAAQVAALSELGDVLSVTENVDAAEKVYSKSLEIARRLAAADPSHAERARDVSVSVNKIGDVLVARDDLAGR